MVQRVFAVARARCLMSELDNTAGVVPEGRTAPSIRLLAGGSDWPGLDPARLVTVGREGAVLRT